MSDHEDEIWELKLELAMMKDSLKNAPRLTNEQILNPDANANAPHDFGTREEKIARIMKDPKPEWDNKIPRIGLRNLLVIDEELANQSEPEAKERFGQPHKVGRFKPTDKLEDPAGFIAVPPKGTPIEAIKDAHPAAYRYLLMQKVTHF